MRVMKATLRLDPVNHRFVFESEDFFLRFAISHLIQKIDEVMIVEGDFISFMTDGYEEHLCLQDVLTKMGLTWDFSKYDLEVLL